MGKTETVKRRARTVYQLDKADSRIIFQADPEVFLREPTPVVLDLEADDLLRPGSGSIYGALFESLALLCVRVYAQALEATVGHFRTRAGEHEIDLVLQGRGGATVALEVKTANRVTDHDVKHLLWLRERAGAKMRAAAVLYGGRQAYLRKDGIAVIPLGCLGL